MKYFIRTTFVYIFLFTGLNKLSAQLPITPHPTPPSVVVNISRTNALLVDQLNNKWFGFANYGLGIYDGTTWTMFDTSNSGMPSDSVTSLDFDLTGNCWIGTKQGAVYKSGNTFTIYNTANSGLPDNIVTTVYADGLLTWFGTYHGLASFDGINWNVYNIINSGIANDSITKIIRNANGDLFIGTRNGVSNYMNGTWLNFTPSNSILSRFIFDIEFDNNGRIWISCGTVSPNQYLTTTGIFYLKNNQLFSFANDLYFYDIPLTFRPGVNFTKDTNGNIYFRLGNETGIDQITKVTGSVIEYWILPALTNGVAAFGNIFEIDNNGILFSVFRVRSYIYSFDFSGYVLPPIGGINIYNHRILNINDVVAGINVGGDMHWDYVNAQYEVPKGSGKNSVFASALWIGGLDAAGQLHLAGNTYRQTGNDYWPGPISEISTPFDSSTCQQFDKIWKIDKWKIEEYKNNFLAGNVTNGSYTIPDEILTWPAKGNGIITGKMAPFFDNNGDGIYDPMTGDYPQIKGDQMLYHIFNDSLSIHSETGGLKMGVEVHASAYAFNCFNINDSMRVMNQTTLYNYEIINRSPNNYDSVFVGLWSDMDLGNATDDYVGCDSTKGAGFTYNGDNDDETNSGYGMNPPMQNIKILKGMAADVGDGIDNNLNGITDEAGERTTMNHFQYYNNVNNSAIGNPNGAVDFYNYMRSVWLDGVHVTYGNGGVVPTDFMFSGTPYAATGWSQSNSGNVPADRRFVLSSGPITLLAGDTATIDFAYIFTRDSINPNGLTTSIARNTADLQRVQYWFDNNSFPSCQNYTVGLNETSDNNSTVLSVYPNPATSRLYINFDSAKLTGSKYEIYNLLGEKIKSDILYVNSINIASLLPQTYIIKIQTKQGTKVARFVKL